MWFNARKKAAGSQSDLNHRTCMNVPSNVKWRLFIMHFCLCLFASELLLHFILFFFSPGKHKDTTWRAQAERSLWFIEPEGATWSLSTNLNDPNLPHEAYQYSSHTKMDIVSYKPDVLSVYHSLYGDMEAVREEDKRFETLPWFVLNWFVH